MMRPPLNKGHYCCEWDDAWIEPGDSEMDACICEESEDETEA